MNKKPEIIKSSPYFPVADAAMSVKFYEDVLGFVCDYSGGDPMQFAICSRDEFSVMLRQVASVESILPVERQGGSWDAFFWVSGLHALFKEFQKKNVEVVYPPMIQEIYQMEEFAIRDPDGHVLGFGETLDS